MFSSLRKTIQLFIILFIAAMALIGAAVVLGLMSSDVAATTMIRTAVVLGIVGVASIALVAVVNSGKSNDDRPRAEE